MVLERRIRDKSHYAKHYIRLNVRGFSHLVILICSDLNVWCVYV
jgi:hypothetical protein